MTQSTYPKNASLYRYDSLYNRIKENNTDNAVNALNQILERKDRSYQYDADGNLIRLEKPDKTFHFTYDAAGRMTPWPMDRQRQATNMTKQTAASRRLLMGSKHALSTTANANLARTITGENCAYFGGLGLGAEIGDAIAIEKRRLDLLSDPRP